MKHQAIVITHSLVVIAAYSSPFWLDWRIIAVGVAVYWVQIMIFKACVLSIAQFKSTEESFVGGALQYVLDYVDITLNKQKVKIFLDWVVPPLLLILAYIIQT